ncbi:phosphatase PAP2 family protein [Solibacillus silvestris]|uniref:phosphatase PAP2 family protein n=1 Tax=Solibacillus silvestris TaxID=76853 RepID=UPI003F822041
MKKGAFLFALVALAIFSVIALNYDSASFMAFDERIQSLFQGNDIIISFHYIGETNFILVIAVMLLLYLWVYGKNYRGMLFVLLTLAVGNSINRLLKHYFERPRPEIADQLATFSFPSGHSQMGVLYLLTLAYLFSKMTNSRKKAAAAWVIAIVLAFFIGLSRIAEGRHFPTDVLAGWSIGYIWFIICVIWYESRKYKNNDPDS